MTLPTLRDRKRIWEEKINQQKQSGLSAVRWCQQQRISYNTFAYWRRWFSRSTRTNSNQDSFSELIDSSEETGVVIECSGVRVILAKNFDSPSLARCIDVLRRRSC